MLEPHDLNPEARNTYRQAGQRLFGLSRSWPDDQGGDVSSEKASDPAQWFLAGSEPGSQRDGPENRSAWSTGNHARSLIDGEECFGVLADELSRLDSGDVVYFAAWAADPNQKLRESGPTIGEAMCAALDRGASIYVLFWAPMLGGELEYVRDNKEFAQALAAHGGSPLLDRRVRLLGAHHQKFLVIRHPNRPEADVAFLGGIDPCPSRRDDGGHRGDPQVQGSIAQVYGQRPPWHDVQLQLRGPSVTGVEHCFRERWRDVRKSVSTRLLDAKSDPGELPAALPDPPESGQHAVQLLRTYPAKLSPYRFAPRGEQSIAKGYIKALANAREFVYVEDQFLWSPMVAEVFAEALRRNPQLRMLAVLPRQPDKDERSTLAVNGIAQRRALNLLTKVAGDRVKFLELLNVDAVPIYLHSKVCIIDDRWCAVGSANLNRRSWTYDTELTAAVVDEGDGLDEGAGAFARDFRLRLWREHLRRADDDDADLVDPHEGIRVMVRAAEALENWCTASEGSPRPPGHLRLHQWPRPSPLTRLWATPLARAFIDPDGGPWLPRTHKHG